MPYQAKGAFQPGLALEVGGCTTQTARRFPLSCSPFWKIDPRRRHAAVSAGSNLILVPPGGAARAYTTVRPSQAVGLSFIWLGGPVRNFAISIHDLFRLVDCISQFAQGPCLSDLPMLQRNDFYLRPVRISSHNQFASYRPKAVGELVIEYPADETSVDVAF